eukprot:gene20666-2266_t
MKGALMTMTRHAAWALRKDRIRSNYIALGWMVTPAEEATQQAEGRPSNWVEGADRRTGVGAVPLHPTTRGRRAAAPATDAAVRPGERAPFAPLRMLCTASATAHVRVVLAPLP